MYTALAVTVMQRGRVSNPTGSVQTFTMSVGADSAGTRIYSATPILPGRALDIYGPITLAQGEILQAFGSSTSLVLELGGTEAGDGSEYTTNFPDNEFTTGPWILGGTTGIVWTDPTTSLNTAYGTQPSGSPDTDDSLGLLNFATPPDQYAAATIYQDPTLGGTTYEVELLFRSELTANSFTGYECNLAFNGGYAQVVRLNGALNDYTYVSAGGSSARPVTGDLFEAQIVGNIVTMWLTHNSVRTQINQADVSSIGGPNFTTGKVGVGFWHSNNQRRYGFTDYTVRAI